VKDSQAGSIAGSHRQTFEPTHLRVPSGPPLPSGDGQWHTSFFNSHPSARLPLQSSQPDTQVYTQLPPGPHESTVLFRVGHFVLHAGESSFVASQSSSRSLQVSVPGVTCPLHPPQDPAEHVEVPPWQTPTPFVPDGPV
jgi:hypothetical protein